MTEQDDRDEFMEFAMQWDGPPPTLFVVARIELPNGVVYEPGHYRWTEAHGYERYEPEEMP